MRSLRTASVEMQASILTAFDTIIDVRSAAEFAEDHLPGAINLPVLEDAERARIGTLYKQVSSFEAKRAGAALVARNIARHLESALAGRPRDWRALVYCWRGGKRSGAMAHVLREVGWDAPTLTGGYKAYRRYVVETLSELPTGLAFRVVHGATGSGKSRLLEALSAAGAQVLDLEALARHRGSVLGGLPGTPQPSQKLFETELLEALVRLDPARPVYVEGESRKIGQLQVPQALIETMRGAECIVLVADVTTRTGLLCEEYAHFLADRAALDAQLECLEALHGRARIEEWKALSADAAWPELVQRLLAEHYDPAYRRSALRNFPRLARARTWQLHPPLAAAFARIADDLVAGERNGESARAPKSVSA